MQIALTWTSRLSRLEPLGRRFAKFAQMMANRLIVGDLRYGPPDRRKKYLTRLKMEIKAYERTGNAEQLYNAANYCLLETLAPEHSRHHNDEYVPSVTRRKREVEGD